MKNYYFNIQSKGGVGKSMLTYFQALKYENDDTAAFIDLDSSSHTSSQQLAFTAHKGRVFEIELLDGIKRIDREQLFKVLEALNQTEHKEIFIDFGSSESDQLLRLLTIDFSIEEFKEFETMLEASFSFNIVVAGGTSFAPSCQYMKKISEAIAGKFPINLFVNEFTFKNNQDLIVEVQAFGKNSKGVVKKVIPFGNIFPDRASGIEIMNNIKEGKGLDAYKSFAARLLIKKEVAKI
ncbi:MAG: hypothetical protein J7502_04760 [Flavisolibacter sp.]|nr:hypothetical protein [Flavisolibacter sp.]